MNALKSQLEPYPDLRSPNSVILRKPSCTFCTHYLFLYKNFIRTKFVLCNKFIIKKLFLK